MTHGDIDVDHNPAQVAREARKARVGKNERQRLQNASRADGAAAEREERKLEIEKNLAQSRVSTASMGKFDKRLEGEKKLRGVKRKVSAVILHFLSRFLTNFVHIV